MRPLLFVFLLTLFTLGGTISAEDSVTPDLGFRLGGGLTFLVGDALSDDLSAQGQTPLGDHDLWTYRGDYALSVGTFQVLVSSSRASNALFGPARGSPRTRFISDQADFLAGPRWVLVPHWELELLGGVGLARRLLDLYDPHLHSFSGVLASAGQVSLVGRANWAASGWVGLTFRGSTDRAVKGWLAGIGVKASVPLTATEWTVAEDIRVKGLGSPGSASWTPTVWVGFQ